MSKRIHLIQKYVVFKGNPTLPRLLNFEEFPIPHPHLLSLEECFNPPSPPPPLLPCNLLFSYKVANFFIVFIVFSVYKQIFMAQ